MSYPGTQQTGSSTERTARLVAAIITVLAVVGVLLIAIITSDSAASSINSQGDGGGTQSSTGGDDSLSGGSTSGGVSVGGGGAASASISEGSGSQSQSISGSGGASAPSVTTTEPDFPSSASAPSVSVSTSDSAPKPTAAQVRRNFPLPPGTRAISAYASIKPAAGERFYLTRTSLAATNHFFATKFKAGGWVTYISPSVYKNTAGKTTGYFYIYHLKEAVTTDLGMDANYLDEAPGQVLIRVTVSDD